jgi:nucleoside-diphosphate-sugar epimerase
MKIALIGAGSSVGRYLLAREKNYIGIYRSDRALSQLCDLALGDRLIKAADAASLAKALQGCDAAVTLVNDENPRGALASLQQAVGACASAKVPQLIHLSSASIYGCHPDRARSEHAEFRMPSWNSYANGKQWQELFLQRGGAQPLSSVIVLRPGLIWGPDMAWLRNPAAEVVRGNAWIAEGDGSCNLAHISLVAEAISYFTREKTQGLTYLNLYDEEVLTWGQYYQRLADKLGVANHRLHVIPKHVVPLWLRTPRAVRSIFPFGLAWSTAPKSVKNFVKATARAMQARDHHGRVIIGQNGFVPPAITREVWELKTAKGRPPASRHLELLHQINRRFSAENWSEISQLRRWMWA